jgi:glutamate-1-semialdehyde 2,1-aminomutase
MHTNDDLAQLALRCMPGGVSTNIRLEEGPTRLIADRAAGARVWTLDGRELLDFVSGYGAVLLGYAHPELTAVQARVLAAGIGFNATNPYEIRAAAQLLEHFPRYDMVRFNTTGSEATTAAIGLARAATGRTPIVVFRDHYHGWHGPTKARRRPWPEDGTAPGQYDGDVWELTFNDVAAAQAFFARHGRELACVILEIVMGSGGARIASPEFVQTLHAARDEFGFVLIADEVITGFRLGLGGAQQAYGVAPDLSVFGKALGGGMPIGAIAGPARLMELFANGRAVHAGTFNGHPLASASAEFMVRHLAAEQAHLYPNLQAVAEHLRSGLTTAARSVGLRCEVRGPGPFLWMDLGVDEWSPALYRRFQNELFDRGVRVAQGGRWFLNASHTLADAERTVAAARDALEIVARAPQQP